MNSPLRASSAFQFPEICVFEASAGSGKTYALATRYVQLLLLNARSQEAVLQPPFRSILALTFTNKAAFGMKQRILEFLKKMAFNKLSDAEVRQILAPLGIHPQEASKLAIAAMESLIRSYNYFQVQTIDKFINALLVGCAFRLGLTSSFRIKTNSREYVAYALDSLIDQALDDRSVRAVFENFVDSFLYLENRGQWLPRKSILEILSSLFSIYDTYGLSFAYPDLTPETIIREKQDIIAAIRRLSESVPPADLHGGFVKSMTSFLEAHPRGFDFDDLSDYFAREEIPLKKDAAASGDVYGQWDDLRERIRKLALIEVNCLYNPYLVIFDQARPLYEQACRRDDVLFLSELNRKARSVFDDGITPEEIYYRMASRFRHYLIDEFQDTSRLQWKNLRLLPDEALATGGSLFYVGDKKQAIYSFRGGDVRLFDEAPSDFAADNVRKEQLQTNWRSLKAIVDFNNTVFSADNLRRFIACKDDDDDGKAKKDAVGFSEEDLRSLEQVYAASYQHCNSPKETGRVCMEYVDGRVREETLIQVKERLLNRLADVRQRWSWKDVVILSRSNSELEVVSRWLLENDIPAASERTSDIRQHPLINEILAFLRFMHQPSDNSAFGEFISGAIFREVSGLKEAVANFLITERQKPTLERELLYIAFRETFPEIWEKRISGFFRGAGLHPLYELVATFYSEMGVLEIFPSAQGFLMHFLELVRNREEEYYDIGAFLADFETMEGEALYVKVSDENALRLMTFHKAKGLEFPVVILPFLTMKVDVGSGGADKKQAFVIREQDGQVRLLRLKKNYGKYADEARELYEDEYKKNLLSELNTIYVALTRPSHELYGFIPARAGSAKNLVRRLLPETGLVQGSPVTGGSRESSDKSRRLSVSFRRHWVSYLYEEFLKSGDLNLRRERRSGEWLHALLARIREIPPGAAESCVKQALLKAGAVDNPVLMDQLVGFLQAPAIQGYFKSQGCEIYTEQEFIDEHGGVKRVDRLHIFPDRVVILDFKSSIARQEEGEAQVREYARLLKGIYPGRRIEGVLLFIHEREASEVKLK